MFASYRLGLSIVVVAVLLGASFTLAIVPSSPRAMRAGQDLGDAAYPLGHFALTERSGRAVTDADLAGDVWIASFLFTRCPSSCPRIAEVLRGLQVGRLKDVPVRLVSISVDPEHDTPEVLSAFARTRDADPDRWWFLTGDKGRIYDLILKEFHLPVAPGAEGGPEAVAHSDRLALVDRGNRVVGVFSSSEPEAIDALVAQARRRAGQAKPWVRSLPAVNASLNATCGLLLSLGLAMILAGRWRAHAVCMISGTIVGVLFLGCYLVYHYHVGSVPFRGTGTSRFVYFTILTSHTALAALGVVPLAAITLSRALRRRFDAHARIARVTFPIWMYVSITGVVIYVMLYQLPIPDSTAETIRASGLTPVPPGPLRVDRDLTEQTTRRQASRTHANPAANIVRTIASSRSRSSQEATPSPGRSRRPRSRMGSSGNTVTATATGSRS